MHIVTANPTFSVVIITMIVMDLLDTANLTFSVVITTTGTKQNVPQLNLGDKEKIFYFVGSFKFYNWIYIY